MLTAMPARHDPEVHVRRTFFRDGRLTALPTRGSYRMAALAALAERFDRDRLYDEREVCLLYTSPSPRDS